MSRHPKKQPYPRDGLLEWLSAPCSDEVCVQIAAFLSNLALLYESTHIAKILRYNRNRQRTDRLPIRPRKDPVQLDLFADKN